VSDPVRGDRDHLRLDAFAANVASQFGEDGIIERILAVIGECNGWCVEFGAWDGERCSNTFNLFTHKGYSAVLIEADPQRFQALARRFAENPNVLPLNAWVGFEAADNLDSLLAPTPTPTDFDLLSIDIDGNDYHAWKAISRYRPKVVVIEFNPTIPSEVEFVQHPDPRLTHGASLLSLAKLGASKGYELVAVTLANALFVERRFFPLFGLADNRLATLRSDTSLVTYLFSGYDGQVFLSGCGRLPWHDVPYRADRMQVVPAWLRRYPDRYDRLRRILARLYGRWARFRLFALSVSGRRRAVRSSRRRR